MPPWQQRMPRQQLSQCVYSGSISGSIFMLSIIQLVTPPWASPPDREPAHWSSAMGESCSHRKRRSRVKRNNAEKRRADLVGEKRRMELTKERHIVFYNKEKLTLLVTKNDNNFLLFFHFCCPCQLRVPCLSRVLKNIRPILTTF